ncbi:hypothetical protein [Nocardia araoensis]|uniref:hypothetical protein n=1 Tax=Nocardia araoensis TaxID=228600 RepID=UPI0003180248|nr:hypothetical protein [Nocardia araoensis]
MSNDDDHGGRVFREAWIAGVTAYYPGTPKDGYMAPWEDVRDWERASAAAVYGQVVAFLELTRNAAARLSPELKGQFVAICWIGQILARIPDPKPGYIAPWEQLPEWQKKTDIGIFEAIERRVEVSGSTAAS